MHKSLLLFGAIAGGIAVILGAMAAHSLRAVLSNTSLDVFETAVRYQFYHVFAMLICGLLANANRNTRIRQAGFLFAVGMILFCGSLYLITWMQFRQLPVPLAIGLLTPLGGVFFYRGMDMVRHRYCDASESVSFPFFAWLVSYICAHGPTCENKEKPGARPSLPEN